MNYKLRGRYTHFMESIYFSKFAQIQKGRRWILTKELQLDDKLMLLKGTIFGYNKIGYIYIYERTKK